MKQSILKYGIVRFSILMLLICVTTGIFAQSAPHGFNYQAVARDVNGNAYVNKSLVVEVTIRSLSASGTIVWQEGHNVTTNEFGLFSLVIGNGVTTGLGTLGSFSMIPWSSGPYFLRVRVDYGNGLVDMGTMQFLSVPYALMADSVANYPDPWLTAPDTVNASHMVVKSIQIPSGAGNGFILGSDAKGNATWQSIGGDVTGTIDNLKVIGIQGRNVTTTAPADGQILKWNATTASWELAYETGGGTVYTPGSGISFNGTVINAEFNLPIWNAGQIVGQKVTGTAPSVDGQVLKWSTTTSQWELGTDNTAGSYASGTGINISNDTIHANAGTAIWNASQIQGTNIDNTIVPVDGDVLKWNAVNGQWEASPDAGNAYTGGAGISIAGTTIHADTAASVWSAARLQGENITTVTPTITGQILKWNNTTQEWELGTDNTAGTYTGGTGITITGTTIDADASAAIWNANQLAGTNINASLSPALNQILKWNGTEWDVAYDLEGPVYSSGLGIAISNDSIYATPDVPIWNANRIQSFDISSVVPGNNQVLTYDSVNSTWVPATFATTGVSTFTGGSGISISQSGSNITITNTGDTNALDDITTATLAGGDLSGNYPDPTVIGIQGRSVTATAPVTGQILKWDGSAWNLDTDSSVSYTGGAGITITGTTIDADASTAMWNADRLRGDSISTNAAAVGEVLKWDGTAWTPAADAGATYTGGTGITITGTTIDADAATAIWNANQIQGNNISVNNPNDGEVLKWNNASSEWEPAIDDNTTYTAGDGITIDGTNTINTLYDSALWNARKLYNYNLQNVVPGNNQVLTYDSANAVWKPVTFATTGVSTFSGGSGISVSQTGSNVTITNTGDTNALDDITTSTPAGGDLSGTYPDPTVIGIQGNSVTAAVPSNGEILKWDGTTWSLASDSSVSYTGGTGITITGTTIDADASTAMWNANQLQGNDIDNTAPTNGQVLKWNGTAWAPAADSEGTYKGLDGIEISNDSVMVDLDATSGLTFSVGKLEVNTGNGLTITGTHPNSRVEALFGTAMWNADKLQGNDIDGTAPSVGEVLKWDGTAWAPATDTGYVYTGGTGITITGTTIDADATTAMWNADKLQGNDISTTAPTNGQVLKWNATTSQWEPDSDSSVTYTAGDGINIDGNNEITVDLTANSGLQFTGGDLEINVGDGVRLKNGALETDLSANSGLRFDGGELEINPGTNLSLSGNVLEVAYGDPEWNANKLQSKNINNTAPTNGQVLKWNATTSEWTPSADDVNTYIGGTGITITGTTIDADATTAMWNADQLQGNDISTTAPTNGQVLKWNATTSVWEPAADDNTAYTGGTGITITGTTIDADATTAMWNADQLQGNDISTTAPTNGQVLKWNATTSVWEPAVDDNTAYTGGTGITITGTTIDADATTAMWNADQLQGNDISTTAPTNGQVLKWNATTSVWEPAVDNSATYTGGTGITITGTTIDADATTAMWNADQLQGNDISTTTPTNGQVLKWNATTSVWEPSADNSSNYTAGNGINIDGSNVVTVDLTANSGLQFTGGNLEINAGDGIRLNSGKLEVDLSSNSGLSFDAGELELNVGTNLNVSGNVLEVAYGDPEWNANKLQSNNISTTAPTNGQVLKWNGTTSEWEPSTDNTALMTGGDGIDVTGTVASVDLVVNGGLEISAGELKATYEDAMWNADQLQSKDVSAIAPTTTGQVLRYNATTNVWEAGDGVALSDADNDTKVQVEESADEDKIRFDIAGTEAMIIDDARKVGIGTSLPTSTLTVEGSYALNITTTSISLTLTADHNVIIADNLTGLANAITLSLPAASTCKGRVYTVKTINGGLVELDPNGSETIDGATSHTISATNQVVRIISNGSNWYIIGTN